MAEFSGLWTTSGSPSGDQQASYTQAQLAIMHKIVAACSGFEGVAPGYLNGLAVTANGANTVAVATGGAMVDGLFYQNDASQNINIQSASGGGNTRIDRIVLRASWSGFNVSAHRIAGTNAAEPVAPAMTQNSGSTYDIPLARVLVTTAGAVTVTDERVWALVDRDNSTIEHSAGALQVKNLGITTAKIANDAIDDTKAGNRVPQLYRRQGGDATSWASPGTTDRTPGAVRIQTGVVECTIPNGQTFGSSVAVTFPVAFSAPPNVFTEAAQEFNTQQGNGRVASFRRNVTATGFVVNIYTTDGAVSSGTTTRQVSWLAIGPE